MFLGQVSNFGAIFPLFTLYNYSMSAPGHKKMQALKQKFKGLFSKKDKASTPPPRMVNASVGTNSVKPQTTMKKPQTANASVGTNNTFNNNRWNSNSSIRSQSTHVQTQTNNNSKTLPRGVLNALSQNEQLNGRDLAVLRAVSSNANELLRSSNIDKRIEMDHLKAMLLNLVDYLKQHKYVALRVDVRTKYNQDDGIMESDTFYLIVNHDNTVIINKVLSYTISNNNSTNSFNEGAVKKMANVILKAVESVADYDQEEDEFYHPSIEFSTVQMRVLSHEIPNGYLFIHNEQVYDRKARICNAQNTTYDINTRNRTVVKTMENSAVPLNRATEDIQTLVNDIKALQKWIRACIQKRICKRLGYPVLPE